MVKESIIKKEIREFWIKKGAIDLLKEIKKIHDSFAVESEADNYTLDFIKRKIKNAGVKTLAKVTKDDVLIGVELSIKEILNTSNITHAEMIAILELVKHEIMHFHDVDANVVMVGK